MCYKTVPETTMKSNHSQSFSMKGIIYKVMDTIKTNLNQIHNEWYETKDHYVKKEPDDNQPSRIINKPLTNKTIKDEDPDEEPMNEEPIEIIKEKKLLIPTTIKPKKTTTKIAQYQDQSKPKKSPGGGVLWWSILIILLEWITLW